MPSCPDVLLCGVAVLAICICVGLPQVLDLEQTTEQPARRAPTMMPSGPASPCNLAARFGVSPKIQEF